MNVWIDRAPGAGDGLGAPVAEPPVYRQIAERIRAEIAAGELGAGARLPPIRQLARSLGVHRDTVALAYETLAAEGVVESQVGRGTFVRTMAPAPAAPVALRLSASAERLLEVERALPRYAAGEDTIPLHALMPDPSLFPVEAFRRSVNRALAHGGAALLGYGEPQGHAGLREVLAQRLRGAGVAAAAESLVLCQGASQGIALALRLLADPGDHVAVEEPTYQNALTAIEGLGLHPAPVPMGPDGLDLDALERVLARPEVRLLYTIPTFHNPLGVTTSLAHRRAVLALAARHGKAVVEDAYEMDLRFEGRPVPPLAALDESGLVVLLTSFSKSLFPGLRIGAVLARGRLVDALLVLRHVSDLGGALPLQAALADFVACGGYERHLASLRRELRARRDVMLEALAAHMPEGARWTRPEGGLQLWLELPEPVDSRDVFADALRVGVLIAPGHQFLADRRPSRGVRLSLSLAGAAEIREGVARLGRALAARRDAGARGGRRAPVHV